MVFGFWSLRIIASPHFGKLVFVYALQNRVGNHDNYLLYESNILKPTPRRQWDPGNPHPSNP